MSTKETGISEDISVYRNAEYPVDPLFIERWSSRSFADKSVSSETLYTVLEAARWAPSSSNLQPWRFAVAQTEEEHTLFQQFILPGNRLWTDKAPVLILIASDKRRDDSGEINSAHKFDAGTAWGYLSIQANLLGLSTRAIGGFNHEKAIEVLGLPEYIEPHAVVALGYQGTLDQLDEKFHDKDKPTGRRKLSESILKIRGLTEE
ncbi:nitroreductase family protein [Paenibacillus sp. An7]|uniref:nitroreductase family protein n=1 Tax=Paenibacillus sp. An7 TaxID=2689577 RepID=UPI001F183D3F|nr:nitroreductase family protein [Paenibacillus sp. An7]